jgi:hypothetical protein
MNRIQLVKQNPEPRRPVPFRIRSFGERVVVLDESGWRMTTGTIVGRTRVHLRYDVLTVDGKRINDIEYDRIVSDKP